MTVATLTVKGVFQPRNAAINPVAIPAATGLKTHMVTVNTSINRHQMFLMMEKDIALATLHLDNYRLLDSQGRCRKNQHPRQQYYTDPYVNHPALQCL